MKVSVITILGHQAPLAESASAAAEGRPFSFATAAIETPFGFDLDERHAAVPVGDLSGAMDLATLQPGESPQYAVRGEIEVDSIDEVPESVDGAPIFADPHIAPFVACPGTPPVGAIADVQAKLNAAALHGRGLDGQGVAVAIVDTGINLAYLKQKLGAAPLLDAANSWAPSGSTTPAGGYPVAHGTMCAFDVLSIAPRATLLDLPVLSTPAPGGSPTSGNLSVALQAFAQLIAFWGVAFAPGGAGRYTGLVVNNSWGVYNPSWDFPAGHPGRYIDNPNHPFNVIVGVLARSGADILFAAGNCGATCPDGRCQNVTTSTITGANALKDVLTLGGCDVQDTLAGYSSQGPSIAGMYQNKPDLAAYTHFLGSEALGKGSPDSGTSAACPIATGCIAALRTKLPPTTHSPAALIQQLQATVRPPAGRASGWNADFGYGIIDADGAAQSLGI